MLVDDAVVVVDAIHYRMVRGTESIQACLEGSARCSHRC